MARALSELEHRMLSCLSHSYVRGGHWGPLSERRSS